MAKVVDNRAVKPYREPQVGDLVVLDNGDRLFICLVNNLYCLVLAVTFIEKYVYDSIEIMTGRLNHCIKEIIPAEKITITIND